MDDRIVRCGIVSSCQLAATSEIVKRLWPRVCLMQEALSSIEPYRVFTRSSKRPALVRVL